MAIYAYRRGASVHVRNECGDHWYLNQYGSFTRVSRSGAKLHGRPAVPRGFVTKAWVLQRSVRHRLMNAVTAEGSWAWYFGRGERKGADAPYAVEHRYVPRRKRLETLLGHRADDYARQSEHGWATRGHSSISYEWCHLIAHGLGGSDNKKNVVAATAYCNTEQLILECVLYEYRQEGLSVDVQAKLAKGTEHLGECINYSVNYKGSTVYSRLLDCRRATNVTYNDFAVVSADMREKINAKLKPQVPVDGTMRALGNSEEDGTEDSAYEFWC
ncbi:MAG: DNA/RNA non-specific endonuclease [Planctomycetota bacterium]